MPTLVRFRDLHESNWVGLKGFFNPLRACRVEKFVTKHNSSHM